MGFRPLLHTCGMPPIALLPFAYTSDGSTDGDSVIEQLYYRTNSSLPGK